MKEVFPTFNDIEYKPLRTWNRCVLFFNLKEDLGAVAAERYLKNFAKDELSDMYTMYQDVMTKGREVVLKEIQKHMPLQEEEEYVH